MNQRILEKLEVLSDAAKYDVSCASSGSKRSNVGKGLGNATGMGICHSYTEDGRCVSLLKVLMTNFCIYDCAYCVSRRSNDVKRVGFTVNEIVELTVGFYRRNYIEGLFLSSGIFKSADHTTERLVRVAKLLRNEHNFNGYIHLKVIPGSSPELIHEAGLYADRLSVNLEIPSEEGLKHVAPEKSFADAYAPMNYLKGAIAGHREDRKNNRKAPLFAPGGQSTQVVIGATPESDRDILQLSSSLYRDQGLKRVYYSGYIPVSDDSRLPALSGPPLIRENRLYQADWLMRFYGFEVNELVDASMPQLAQDMDPKLAYALRNPHLFPIDLNRADYEMLLRVPGIGVKSAKMIVKARRFGRLRLEDLRKMGAAVNRAKFFLDYPGRPIQVHSPSQESLKTQILLPSHSKRNQLSLF